METGMGRLQFDRISSELLGYILPFHPSLRKAFKMHNEKNWLVGRDENDFLKPTQTIQTVLNTHKLKYFVGLSWNVITGYQHFFVNRGS